MESVEHAALRRRADVSERPAHESAAGLRLGGCALRRVDAERRIAVDGAMRGGWLERRASQKRTARGRLNHHLRPR